MHILLITVSEAIYTGDVMSTGFPKTDGIKDGSDSPQLASCVRRPGSQLRSTKTTEDWGMSR